MADPFFVILVSGDPAPFDDKVPSHHHDGFAVCAWLRVAELVGQFFRDRKKSGALVQADTVLRFIHFDCHISKVGIYEHDFAKQKDTAGDLKVRSVHENWKTLDAHFETEHGPLSQQQDPKDFVEWKQISDAKAAGSKHPLSIVNVYHSVRKAPPGSVLELSIFSHAFVDGPVLFDTSATPGSTRRSQDDTDGRAAIDFQPDMGEDGPANVNACALFRQAFAGTGSFRIWGCNIQDIVDITLKPDDTQKSRCLIRSTVLEVVNESFTRQLRLGGAIAKLLRDDKHLPPGSTKISLDMDREIGHEVEMQTDPSAGAGFTPLSYDRLFEIRYDQEFDNHSYHAFFQGERDSKGDYAKTIIRSLSDIVKFVAAETTTSYFFVAAQALKTVTVVGGAPGTSADVRPKGQQFIALAELDEAKFFSKFFGASMIDPDAKVKRHYTILDKDGKAVKAILDRQANGLP